MELVKQEMTIEEAKERFQRNVANAVEEMRGNGVSHGAFLIKSSGLHAPHLSFEIGACCDSFRYFGYEVVSHNLTLLKLPNTGDETWVSLLVRKLPPDRATDNYG
jgi:hypothetical protein